MPDREVETRISDHYGWSRLIDAIEAELRRNGIDPQHVTVDELAPVDNFHWFRLAGTLALAQFAGIAADDRVLDVGGGVGGPARQLASRFGCEVTVLDLTTEYCAVGETLTGWTGLADRVRFSCANALDMPFPDASFDVVWTQHASMNIPDKVGLYREIARVVRPGGRFAVFDVFAGPNQPIHFPVPWAVDQSYSFLQAPGEARATITDAGFREVRWMTDQDPELKAALEGADRGSAAVAGTQGLNPDVLYGTEAPRIRDSMRRNSQQGRLALALGVFERI